MLGRDLLSLGDGLADQSPTPQRKPTADPGIGVDRRTDRRHCEVGVTGVAADLEHELARGGIEHPRDLAVEVGGDAVADIGLDQALEPVAGRGLLVESDDRRGERRHRRLGVAAQLGDALGQAGEVPDLGRGHEGERRLVADRRRERGICCESLERDQLGIGQHPEQLDDRRAIAGIVHQCGGGRGVRQRVARGVAHGE